MRIIDYSSNNINFNGFGASHHEDTFLMAYAVTGLLELKTASALVLLSGGNIGFYRAKDFIFPLPKQNSTNAAEYCLVFFIPEKEEIGIIEALLDLGIQKLKPGLGFTREQMERRLRINSPAMRISAEYYFLSFIYDFTDSGVVKSSSAVLDRHLENAILYMKKHLEDSISLEEIAEAINISKTHLIRIFRNELGMSPIHYFTTLKVEESSKFLSGTNMTLDQIAEKLNFYSDSHFSKVFKKITGENPSAYRHNYIDSLLSKQKKSIEEIEKSYLFIQQLIDATDDLIFYKNTEGRYIGCNIAFCDFTSLSREEIIGKTDFDFFPSEMAQGFIYNDKMVLQTAKVHHNEEWIKYKNGKNILVEVSKSPFYGLHGEIGGIIGISRDITYRRMAEDRLLVAKEEAEKGRKDSTEETISCLKTLFEISDISSSFISMLRLSESDQEKLSIIDKIINAEDSGRALIQTFTGIREIERNTFNVNDVFFPIREIISASENFCKNRFPELNMEVRLDDTIPMFLTGPKTAIETAVNNLLTHIGNSGADRLLIMFNSSNEKLLISVSDNGTPLLGNRKSPFLIEIPDSSRVNREWDIYLWFCQDIVEYIHGEWNIINNEEGTTVTMIIPIRRGFT